MADDSNDPVLRHARGQKVDQLGTRFVDQAGKFQDKVGGGTRQNTNKSEKKGPAGGYDSTPIPKAPPGYTIKITFHRASNLPFADINTLSSDPYVLATLKTTLAKRNKQDPDLVLRTPTIHRNTDPTWDTEWIIANVPSSGFFLKCRLYDEDPADHDDRLGNAHINVSHIDDSWTGFQEQSFDLKKRMASKRAYTFRGCAALFNKNIKMGGELIVSVQNLGRTKDENGGRAYTIGPLAWSRHYSPLIGRLAGTKDTSDNKDGKPGTDKYNFQAVQMQLAGPVPEHLYHRYVEFRPFVAGMFTDRSLRGRILNRALHHQHARIYNYDRSTVYGSFEKPCEEMTKNFLDLVHYDQGGRIFTYVITLDGHWRFTETGKEFGIDLLSKHTMHSDVSIYIAFSGEFFIRRVKHSKRNQSASPDPATQTITSTSTTAEHPEQDERPKSSGSKEPPKDPLSYELIIDNDSGTYRPNAEMLPQLKEFLATNLPGLKVATLDCQADEEKMTKLKNEQRERKKNSGQNITYLQNNSTSSISSSDEEKLDAMQSGGPGRENKAKQELHKYVGHGHDDFHGDDQVNGESSRPVGEKLDQFEQEGQNNTMKGDAEKTMPQTDGQTDATRENTSEAAPQLNGQTDAPRSDVEKVMPQANGTADVQSPVTGIDTHKGEEPIVNGVTTSHYHQQTTVAP